MKPEQVATETERNASSAQVTTSIPCEAHHSTSTTLKDLMCITWSHLNLTMSVLNLTPGTMMSRLLYI